MSTFPPSLPKVPIIVPEGFASPGAILPLPVGSTVTAIGITPAALDRLDAAAERSADERPASRAAGGAGRAQLVQAMRRIALGRIVWAHLDPAAAALFF